jgi:hypothetical protein
MQVKNHAAAWPFLKPVDKAEVPDYYDHIKYPMGECITKPHCTVICIVTLKGKYKILLCTKIVVVYKMLHNQGYFLFVSE